MRRLLLSSVFIGAFAFAAVANAPLSFVMKASGLDAKGISWQQARGSLWHGQIMRLTIKGDQAGAIEGDFSLIRFVRGQPAHLLRWSGPFGHGSAFAGFSRDGVRLKDGRASARFDATRISAIFPAQDVSLHLSDVSMELGRDGCRSASGNVSTDALAHISAAYGATWPELTGFLSCEQGELVISVKGQAADGTQIAAKAYLKGGGQLELWDVPDSKTNALLIAGFTNEAGKYVYLQQSPNGEASQ